MRTSLILLMLLFVAAGCGGTEESSTNPTSLASPVSTTVSSAATLAPTPAPPVPTSAPEPDRTPTSVPIPTDTPDPTPVDTSAPTPTNTPVPEGTPEPTPLPTQTPLPPPGVVVDLEIANVTENSITLQWKPPDNSNVVPIEHYEVTRDIAFRPDEHHAVAETTFIDTELESSTEHRYRVRAIGPGGIEGAEISIVGSTLDSATPAPNRTPIPEPTPTDTPQPTATRTSLPTATATLTPVPTSTPTSLPTATATLTPVPTSTPTSEPTQTPTPVSTQELRPATPTPTTSLAITVAPIPADIPEYSRSQWKHWTDEDGDCQDARQEALISESLVEATFESERKCRVATGRWYGAFAGIYVEAPGDFDIDHLVPLKNAHDSGGWAWSSDRKQEYANYLVDPDHLIAVTKGANRSKGARGPEEWRPPDEGYWCEYATDWTEVKMEWGLTMTQRETEAVIEMLDTCEEPVEVKAERAEGTAGTDTSGRAASGEATATPTLVPEPEGNPSVYRSCEEAVEAGESRVQGSMGGGKGFPEGMVPSARDGDGDGVVCER